ncbi:MAG: hypothetical protein KKI09_07480 [Spirochaetes bacterium]|nr:hypothetical protein [Spirochaetota bacterium]MBU0955253.1 hypothetical protein [Spirochaetota bacterium]
MLKRIVIFLLVLSLGSALLGAQTSAVPEQPIPLFSNPALMTGLILEATGFGLVIGGGTATSVSLDAALVMMQIAPIFSASGAWVSHSNMEKQAALWQNRGLVFDSSSYVSKSRTAAIGTTAFAAGALLFPLLGEVGIYLSLACTGVSVGWDMYALYAVRSIWLRSLNTAILDSGIDWKSYQ